MSVTAESASIVQTDCIVRSEDTHTVEQLLQSVNSLLMPTVPTTAGIEWAN